jgi:hypothetical protein
VVEGIYQKVSAMKAKRNDSNLNATFKPLDEAYTSWLKAIKSDDKSAMNTTYNNFMNAFPKPYMASF